MTEQGYLHGYTTGEQDRLVGQGDSLENFVYPFIDLNDVRHCLEVGCGVGAQTKILLRRFPRLRLTSVDFEPTQICKAKQNFAHSPDKGRVDWELADVTALPYANQTFDGAFGCWVLEHVPSAFSAVHEIFRVLKNGGVFYSTEVLNTPLYTFPDSLPLITYWRAYNEHQQSIGGDPFVGARLPNLLLKAGFSQVETHTITYHVDNRMDPERRKASFDYWKTLFFSAAPELLKASRITQSEVDEMAAGFEALKAQPDSVFFMVAMQAKALKEVKT